MAARSVPFGDREGRVRLARGPPWSGAVHEFRCGRCGQTTARFPTSYQFSMAAGGTNRACLVGNLTKDDSHDIANPYCTLTGRVVFPHEATVAFNHVDVVKRSALVLHLKRGRLEAEPADNRRSHPKVVSAAIAAFLAPLIVLSIPAVLHVVF
jgi:hypothetical protein